MYFNHAYRKAFLGVENQAGDLTVATTGTTAALTAGQLGLFDAKTYGVYTPSNKPFIIAQGSWYKSPGYSDKIGPYHGGYQESVKTKVINPKYVTRVFTTCATPAINQVISIGWDLADGDGFLFECGMTYRLRIDLKGSPALRFLSHNVYNTVDSYSGCCTDECTATCTGDPVDAACVLLGWKDQIYRNPWMTQFILPQVYIQNGAGDAEEVYSAADVEAGRNTASFTADTTNTNDTLTVTAMGTGSFPIAIGMVVTGAGIPGGTTIASFGTGEGGVGTYTLSANATATATGVSMTAEKAVYTCETVNPEDVVAGLKLSVAYQDTKFGMCTFTPTDHYELEPLLIFTSITDESGDPCSIKPIANSSTGEFVTEIQAPAQTQGSGETVIRDLILDARYRQEAYPDSMNVNHLRMREIESNPVLLGNSGQTIRTSLYDSINILHSVPRFNNPTGTFDNDQYLITIYVPTGTDCVDFLDDIQTALNCAGNGITVESWDAGRSCATMVPTVAPDVCI